MRFTFGFTLFGRKLAGCWAAAATLVLMTAAPGRPALAAPADEPVVTDVSVDRAITKAVDWLKSQRKSPNMWEPGNSTGDEFWAGDSALVILSLLYAGEDPRVEFMKSSLDWLAAQPLRKTYTYGTRAHALALVPGDTYRGQLKSDLDWLVTNVNPKDSTEPGSYGYTAKDSNWDNSNSQYGVLGVWMASDAGFEAPLSYWEMVGEHWMKTQQDDGGWSYKGGKADSTGSMTAAGLATMFVVLDRLYGEPKKDAASVLASITRGLDWLAREYTPERNPGGEEQWLHYYLYGVERAGRASGYKYFRSKDWFREGAAYLLRKQSAEGNWEIGGSMMGGPRNTCFSLMFLCHGRAPLFANKLQHGADWNLKLRDAAGITHYTQRTLERLLNWQIVRLDSSMDDLMEAPILYMSGKEPWEFEEVQIQKIKDCCLRGGMVLAVSAGDGFRQSMQSLAERAFPEFPMRPLASDHPLFTGEVQFEIKKPPLMFEVNNGIRTLMLLSADDIAETWNRGKGNKEHLWLGCNIYDYATDKAAIHSRLETTNIPLKQIEPRRKIEIAIIKYKGLWNVEPYGWTRFKNYMNNEAGTRLLITSGVPFDSADLKKYKVAFVTGTQAMDLSAEERKGLQQYLRDGGTIIADAAGGSDAFRKSLDTLVTEALKVESVRVPKDSFLFSGAGITDAVSLEGINYTRAARGAANEKFPPLRAFDVGRRLAVIYSPLDISAGLLGTHIYNRKGYEGDGPLRVLRNLVLYSDLPTRDKSRLGHP